MLLVFFAWKAAAKVLIKNKLHMRVCNTHTHAHTDAEITKITRSIYMYTFKLKVKDTVASMLHLYIIQYAKL